MTPTSTQVFGACVCVLKQLIFRHRKQTYGHQGGQGGGWDELGDWDRHIYIYTLLILCINYV